MHAPRHEDELPEHVPPMVMPDTPEEARQLLLCLEAGVLPTYRKGPDGEIPARERSTKEEGQPGDDIESPHAKTPSAVSG